MSNLTYQSPRAYFVQPQVTIDYPVTNAAIVYEGSALSDTSSVTGFGGGNPFSGTNVAHTLVAGEAFLGFANATINNTAGTNGGTTISTVAEGIVKLTITGLTAGSTGEYVYATDGNTFSVEVQEYTNTSIIGRVTQIISVSAGTAWVHFQGAGLRSIN